MTSHLPPNNDPDLIFKKQELNLFADMSHDRNPLHLDADYARASPQGQVVVFGILAVLTCLERLQRDSARMLRELEIRFLSPLFPDTAYGVEHQVDGSDHGEFSIWDGKRLCLQFRYHLRDLPEDSPHSNPQRSPAESPKLLDVARVATEKDLAAGQSVQGIYQANQNPFAERFAAPPLCALQRDILALCSYLIGMELPGQQALFSSLALQFGPESCQAPQPFSYKLESEFYDQDHGLLRLDLKVAGGRLAKGQLKAFVRSQRVPLALEKLRDFVRSEACADLSGQVALVTGGSRGFGAALTRTISLLNGVVYLNFKNSVRQAQAIKQELEQQGKTVHLLQGDIGDSDFCSRALQQIARHHGRLDHLICNAAEPPPLLSLTPATLPRFHRYLEANLKLVTTPLSVFKDLLTDSAGQVIAISSAFVNGGAPTELSHYVGLKTTVESLIQSQKEASPQLSFCIVRPPPLLTDMNNTPLAALQAVPPEPIALEVVHHMGKKQPQGMTILENFNQRPSAKSAPSSTAKLALAATFTASSLEPSLRFWMKESAHEYEIAWAPYQQIFQQLLDPNSLFASQRENDSVLLLRFCDWFRDKDPATVDAAFLEDALEDLVKAISQFAQKGCCLFVLLCPSPTSGLLAEHGSALSQRLCQALEPVAGVDYLEAAAFHEHYQINDPFDPERDQLAHIPFTTRYFHFLGTLVTRWLASKRRKRYKVLVVDCDNTLWKGVCGEVGPAGVQVTDHYRELQHFLIKQQADGMLVCLCSKNQEADVHAVFQNQAEMVLKLDHCTENRINWLPKSENIRSLAESLNLGIDAFIFLDDNPVECAEVSANCPEVLVIQWPSDPTKGRELLQHCWVFDHFGATAEDRKRSQTYQTEQRRKQYQAECDDFATFIKGLDLQINISPLAAEHISRVSQLAARTNQFNFTTRRFSQQDVLQFQEKPRQRCLTAHVKDRFGDYGLVGVLFLAWDADELHLENLLLSCRVLGRGVEHRLLAELGYQAEQLGLAEVVVAFLPSERNLPARQFLESLAPWSQEPDDGLGYMRFSSATLCQLEFEPNTSTKNKKPRTSTKKKRPQRAPGNANDWKRFAKWADLNLLSQALAAPAVTPNKPSTNPNGSPYWQVFSQVVSDHMGVPLGQLKPDQGVAFILRESFKIIEMTLALKSHFPAVSPTLFFEYDHLGAMAQALENQRSLLPLDTAPVQNAAPKPQVNPDDIAIIGMSGQFPGAPTLEAFWEQLKVGESAIREVPASRWSLDAFYDPQAGPGKSSCKWGGFLEDVSHFDAEFFRVPPKHAELMDPQQRLLLQTVWHLLEDAGIPRREISRHTGVFVGVIAADYSFFTTQAATVGEAGFRGADIYQIANRISHFFDFQGPSMAIDTACSSSATCLDLACRALKEGQCETAVVAGVNLLLHPARFIQYSRMGLLAKEPFCRPFGKDAAGTLFGEGIAALMLKPLAQAEADGNRIHAVIKSTAVNTNGHTQGFTVPSPEAQADLVISAIKQADIDPATIGYIEAHGTGTALGDPIEVRGLAKAFQTMEKTTPMRFLGSIKGNIGHLESCAALAGLIKTVLQMQNETLVPSLNAAEPNPFIDLEKSGFCLPQTCQPWPAPANGPRRAGLSSFGAGGSNAHIVLEAYPQTIPENTETETPFLIPLSARTEADLRALTAQMVTFVSGNPTRLADLAYSLSKGREAMAVRLAVVTHDLEELLLLWSQFTAGNNPDQAYFGKVQPELKPSECDHQETDLHLLAKNWITGQWLLPKQTNGQHRLLRLPHYPFQPTPYWIARSRPLPQAHNYRFLGKWLPGKSLDRGFAFEKNLSPRDPLVAHHLVLGEKVFPAAGYLAMAHELLELCASSGTARIEKIRWTKPCTLETSNLALQTRLEQAEKHFTVEIGCAHDATTPFAKCDIVASPATAANHPDSLNLDAVRQRCHTRLEKTAIYQQFQAMGLDYQPYYQPLTQVWLNETEALGVLELPTQAFGDFQHDGLHPSLIDGALQTTLTLSDRDVTQVPFSAREVCFFAPLTKHLQVHVEQQRPQVFNITMVNEQARPCLTIRDLNMRAFKNPLSHLLFAQTWESLRQASPQKQPLPAQASPPLLVVRNFESALCQGLIARLSPRPVLVLELSQTTRQRSDHHWQIQASDPSALATCLDTFPEPGHIFFLCESSSLQPDHPAVIAHQEGGLMSLFRLVKALLKRPGHRRERLFKIITQGIFPVLPGERSQFADSGTVGLSQVLAKEYGCWQVQHLDCEGGATQSSKFDHLQTWLDRILEPVTHPLVALRADRSYVRKLLPIHMPPAPEKALGFRKHGVYLILGGAGGLGLIWSRYLAKHFQAKLVLLGRRESPENWAANRGQIEALGGEVRYLSVDGNHREDMETTIGEATKHFGTIHGVIHSAIVLNDMSLANMDEADFLAALRPKMDASLNLYHAVRHQPLDFFLFFSSVSSYSSHAGQANYVAGCTFKDAFAAYLEATAPFPVKWVNWGYWGSTGIVATDFYKERLKAQGIHSIQPQQGIQAINQLLAAPLNQLIVMNMAPKQLDLLGVAPNQVAKLASSFLPTLPADWTQNIVNPPSQDMAGYRLAFAELENWGREQLLSCLQELDIFNPESFAPDGFPPWLAPSLKPLFSALLDCLIRAGILARSKGSLHVASSNRVSHQERQMRLASLIQKHPEISAAAELLTACLEAYPALLKGVLDPMRVLFPKGSPERVARFYQGNPRVDYHNRWVAVILRKVQHCYGSMGLNRPLNILEIGAGTGATSRFALKALAKGSLDFHYTYTDISSAFTRKGVEQFAVEYPQVSFRTLDIEKDLLSQGFARQSYDVVLATNVLHATSDMKQTLLAVKQLLVGQGLLVLNEDCRVYDFATMTFGLTAGWWLFKDGTHRLPHGPLLSPESWRLLLAEHGFKDITTFGEPELAEEAYDQIVIVAQSDGLAIDTIAAAPATPVIDKHPLPKVEPSPPPKTLAGKPEAAQIKPLTVSYCIRVFSEVLKMKRETLKAQTTFENYGIDSLVGMEIVERFERDLGTLPSTLLFEHLTIESLADFFIAQHADALHQHLKLKSEIKEPPDLRQKPTSGSPQLSGTEVAKPALAPPKASEPLQDIAIIGIAGRYPDAPDLDTLWQQMETGQHSIREIPQNRWDWRAFFDEKRGVPTKSYSRWGGFIEDVASFDALFFSISPKEAITMDPQERLFLETAWATFEDAGYTRQSMRQNNARTGVFVGVMNSDYAFYGARAHDAGQVEMTHTSFWSCANRVSWFFDLHGPSLAIDTACSSSLAAIHLACENLQSGACDMALAGGVNAILHPSHYQRLCALNMLAGSDKCRSFGAGADGFVPGEGVGAVLLKPLEKALADGDPIHAVIKGSAMNAGGKTRGYTVPNPNAQAQLIESALAKANVDRETIGYIEAHGTGTALGDPIEVAGLNKVFGTQAAEKQPRFLGSIKANIGHLESAAGIAGLTKVVLQMKHDRLVPSLHNDPVNPRIDFQNSTLRLARRNMPWPQLTDHREQPIPKRAGISSFGAGGANVHMILEAFPAPPAAPSNRKTGPQLVLFSARSEEQLTALAIKMLAFLDRQAVQQIDSAHLRTEIARVLYLAPGDLDGDMTLAEAGFDMAGLNQLLEQLGLGKPFSKSTVHLEMTLGEFERALQGPKSAPIELNDLAFTLQIGREHHRVRLALVVSQLSELVMALKNFVAGKRGGDSSAFAVATQIVAADKGAALVQNLLSANKWVEIARLWTAGLDLHWERFHSKAARRISLPTYAFERKRYWLPDALPTVAMPSEANGTQLRQSLGSAIFQSPSLRPKVQRVAVIGAGPSGLATAKCLAEQGFAPTVFEKEATFGGIWAYHPHRKGGAYRSTRLQTSKYTSLFSDFPPSDKLSTFPNAAELETYLQDYVAHFELAPCLSLHSELKKMRPKNRGWELDLLIEGRREQKQFDAVAVCSGAFWHPNQPQFEGLSELGVPCLHSWAYKEPSIFMGKRVLIVGNGVSGMDIAEEAADCATEVYWSIRTRKLIIPRMFGYTPNDCSLTPTRRMLIQKQPPAEVVQSWRGSIGHRLTALAETGLMPDFPLERRELFVNERAVERVASGKIQMRPQISSFSKGHVHFSDGARAAIDLVVFCTGYQTPQFPFLDDIHFDQLYEHQLHPDHPNLSFMGLKPASLCVIPTIELEARWFAAMLKGDCARPSRAEIERETAQDHNASLPEDHIFPIADSSRQDIQLATRIGAFPDPVKDWAQFWELLNLPRIPAIYRLVGPHAWPGAAGYLQQIRQKIFINRQDDRLAELELSLLCQLGEANLHTMQQQGQISANKLKSALALANEARSKQRDLWPTTNSF